jgi:hypothetical protein
VYGVVQKIPLSHLPPRTHRTRMPTRAWMERSWRPRPVPRSERDGAEPRRGRTPASDRGAATRVSRRVTRDAAGCYCARRTAATQVVDSTTVQSDSRERMVERATCRAPSASAVRCRCRCGLRLPARGACCLRRAGAAVAAVSDHGSVHIMRARVNMPTVPHICVLWHPPRALTITKHLCMSAFDARGPLARQAGSLVRAAAVRPSSCHRPRPVA